MVPTMSTTTTTEHATTTEINTDEHRAESHCLAEGCTFASRTGYAARSTTARDTAFRMELWLAGQHLKEST